MERLESESEPVRRPAIVILLILVLLAALPASAQMTVGEYHQIRIDSAREYPGSADGRQLLVWEHQIRKPGATYIAVHFKDFHLAPGDYLNISDAEGGQIYTLAGRGKMDLGDFWARHVKGDVALLQLYATSSSGGRGFVIDEFAAGFEDIGYTTDDDEAICGTDDKENAICYETSQAAKYEKSKAVARLLIGGTRLCTGWLVSAENHLLTNHHCIENVYPYTAENTDYEFMAEAPDCALTNCKLCYPGDVYSGGTLVRSSSNLDYTLVRITSGSPASQYGFLQIDDRQAVVGELIYIPQHPGGRAKELAIESTDPSDGGLCHVATIASDPCTGTGYQDVGYFCDTEGGSSGSPVIAASNNRVIALHHCAYCPNRGVPINLVYSEISDFISECADDTDCDDSVFCNGAERCVDGTCTAGSDPCPGLTCDEILGQCVEEPCVAPDGEYISHFTGLDCTGTESYYTPYAGYQYDCRPDDNDGAVCGTTLRTETNKSYRYNGVCSNAWPAGNTLGEFVRVYREGSPPDGEYISHFSGPDCTGTENYYIAYNDFGFRCGPDNSDAAVCGAELYRGAMTSYRLDGVCFNAWPDGNPTAGMVRVYRGCGVDGTEECGNGDCNGAETCLSCPEDCPDCCVQPDGEYISHFTGPDCTGTESYFTPYDGQAYRCRPDDSTGATCGTVWNTLSNKSYRYNGVCVNAWPEGDVNSGFVTVYRDGCVAEMPPACGDGECNGSESCISCPSDCDLLCCGNGVCDAGECSSCPDDCSYTDCCGNGTCDPMEDCSTCAADCGTCPPYCGDGLCNGKETVRTCPQDCARPKYPFFD